MAISVGPCRIRGFPGSDQDRKSVATHTRAHMDDIPCFDSDSSKNIPNRISRDDRTN